MNGPACVWKTPLRFCIDYRGKSPTKSIEGIPVISAKVVKDGRILHPIAQTISADYYPLWMTRGLPKVGDVVMTTEGPMGEVAQLDEHTVKYALGQRVVCMRGREDVLDKNFLKFLLISPAQQAILHSFATGTTVAGISQKSLRSIANQPAPIPRAGHHRSPIGRPRRQDRTQPPDERDAGGDGAGGFQGLVRRFRPHPRQSQRSPRPTPPQQPGPSSPTASMMRASRRGGQKAHRGVPSYQLRQALPSTERKYDIDP